MRRLHVIGSGVLLVLLAACGTLQITFTTAPSPEATAVSPALTASTEVSVPAQSGLTVGVESSSEEIRLILLRSSDLWATLQLEGVEYLSDPDGTLKVVRHQIWVEQMTAAFRLLIGDSRAPNIIIVGDGEQIHETTMDPPSTRTTSVQPFDRQAFSPPGTASETILPHPLEGQISSAFSSLVFPVGLAQRQGEFVPHTVENIAGRRALIVDWIRPGGERTNRYWIDTERGVILRAQDFGKAGGELIESELIVESIVFDAAFERQLFDPQKAGFTPFSNEGAHSQLSDSPSGKDNPLGAVCFFVADAASGELPRLMRLPGACVVGQSECETPQSVSTPLWDHFLLNQSPWTWSVDGSRAALVHQSDDGSRMAELMVFEPSTNTWQSHVKLPFIDLLAWSGDGEQIAFRAQEGPEHASVYVLSPEDHALRLMFEIDLLPGGVLAVEGWLGKEILVTAESINGKATIYAIHGKTGVARSLFESPGSRTRLIPSPDGRSLLMLNRALAGQGDYLQIVSPQGKTLLDLGAFSGTVHPAVWSADGRQLAVHVLGFEGGEVFVIQTKSGESQKVFSAEAISQLAFSPDGAHLLIEGGDAQNLYRVDLTTMEANLLNAPGSPLEKFSRLATWQPAAQK